MVGLSFNYVSTTFYSVNCTLWYVAGKATRHVMSSIFRNGIAAVSSGSLRQENKCMAYPTSKSQSHPTIYNTIQLFCHQSHFSVINPTIRLSIPLFVQSHYYYSCHHPWRTVSSHRVEKTAPTARLLTHFKSVRSRCRTRRCSRGDRSRQQRLRCEKSLEAILAREGAPPPIALERCR